MRLPKAPRVTVTIDQKHIEDGVMNSSSHCMIADAVKSSYPNAKFVSVDIQSIRFTDAERGLRFVYLTPRIAQVHLVKFDQGIKPMPISFELRNGSVFSSARNRKLITPGSSEKRNHEVTEKREAALKKARLVGGAKSRRDGNLPRVVGGRTPPRLPSQRREFGIKAFGNIAAAALVPLQE